MSKYKYATTDLNQNSAKAVVISAGISTKQSIEVCKHIRGLNTVKAKKILKEAIDLKKAIPFTRFTNGVGHRRGKMGSGSYAPKTCQTILKLIESVEANAQYRGINSSNLLIKHICAQQGTNDWRYGRKRRQQMKSTHVEIVVEETAVAKKKPVAKIKAKTKAKESVKKQTSDKKAPVPKKTPKIEKKETAKEVKVEKK